VKGLPAVGVWGGPLSTSLVHDQRVTHPCGIAPTPPGPRHPKGGFANSPSRSSFTPWSRASHNPRARLAIRPRESGW
jgi:hypothetical protein